MNKQVSLRSWTHDDLDALVAQADNPRIAQWLTDSFPHPYTREDGVRFLHHVTSHDPARVLAVCYNGEPVGSIGVFPQQDIFRKNAELGYWLAEPYWGKGIMTESIRQMCAYGFSHFDIVRIFARPFGTNTASQRVLEKAGFVLEASLRQTIFKNGEWHDELVFAVRRD
jgi:RimJ/RimL family protein N-acetyltransferase